MRTCSLVVLAAVLVSCGGGAKPAAAPPTDDVGRARLLVLMLADLPDGWNASPHRADPVASREDVKLAKCVGAPDPTRSVSADVSGDEFAQGAQSVGSEVVFFKTGADAAGTATALRSARALACAKASVQPVVTEQLRARGLSAKITSIEIAKRTFAVKFLVSAFRVVVTLVAAGVSISVHEDVVVLTRGRAQVRATFVDVGVPFAADLESRLIAALAAKLERNSA